MTIKEMQLALYEKLAPTVGTDEAKAMAKAIIMDIKGYKAIDLALYPDRCLLPETEERMFRIADKVIEGMPLQYAIGSAYFHGRNFAVTTDTLIPRQETSQLVDIIVDQNKDKCDLKILDLGTGSGCIAVSLALDLPFSQVEAIDISHKAIEVARANSKTLKANVDFNLADMLQLAPHGPYDIIVSNPPYVLLSEKDDMDDRVVKHEPHSALFVPDSNPLLFYTAIADFSAKSLKPSGRLYLEINPLSASQLKVMLKKTGFSDVQILRDYKGNIRFAICQL